MRKRLLLVLAIAAAIGFVTSYLVYQVVARVQAGPPSQGTETVVVATANMSLGETITRQHVRTVSWPKASVPATALRSLDDAEGRVVRSSIVTGEPLIEGKLAPRLSGKGGLMAILVPEGQRAVTLKVDDAIRETGFILPNSYIDVLVSMQQPGSNQDRIAKVILQDVQVLASGQTTELRLDPREQTETMTGYIVRIAKGDVPTGTVSYNSIFAVGLLLFVMTLAMNVLSYRLSRKLRASNRT